MIKYIIADDHTVFRQGLKMVLADDPLLSFCGEAENGVVLMNLIAQEVPEVVLLDLKMPVMDGLEATQQIRGKYPDVKILILTMHDDEQMILHMLEAGANGYLLKNADPEEIKLAIHTVAENNYYFNDFVSNAMLKKLVNKNIATPSFRSSPDLSERELTILKLICKEHTSAEIGEKVFLSARTVEGIRAAIMEKIGVRNIAGLVMYAVKNNLVD